MLPLAVLAASYAFVRWPERPFQGPVVLAISEDLGLGVHLTDLLVLPAVAWALRRLSTRLR